LLRSASEYKWNTKRGTAESQILDEALQRWSTGPGAAGTTKQSYMANYSEALAACTGFLRAKRHEAECFRPFRGPVYGFSLDSVLHQSRGSLACKMHSLSFEKDRLELNQTYAFNFLLTSFTRPTVEMRGPKARCIWYNK
jgi:hypothetical protein